MKIGKVEVNTSYNLPVGTSSDGYILQTDISGNVTWQPETGGSATAGELARLDNNTLLLGFYRAIDNSKTIYNMVNGFVDEYEDESGIDLDASINETYDASGDYYTNTSSGGVPMTLISIAQTAISGETTNGVRINIYEEDIDADIILNTDIIAYVSRDNGATWIQATLTKDGNYSSTGQILVDSVDFGSGVDEGIEMKYKIVTTTKELRIHGVGILWD